MSEVEFTETAEALGNSTAESADQVLLSVAAA